MQFKCCELSVSTQQARFQVKNDRQVDIPAPNVNVYTPRQCIQCTLVYFCYFRFLQQRISCAELFTYGNSDQCSSTLPYVFNEGKFLLAKYLCCTNIKMYFVIYATMDACQSILPEEKFVLLINCFRMRPIRGLYDDISISSIRGQALTFWGQGGQKLKQGAKFGEDIFYAGITLYQLSSLHVQKNKLGGTGKCLLSRKNATIQRQKVKIWVTRVFWKKSKKCFLVSQ